MGNATIGDDAAAKAPLPENDLPTRQPQPTTPPGARQANDTTATAAADKNTDTATNASALDNTPAPTLAAAATTDKSWTEDAATQQKQKEEDPSRTTSQTKETLLPKQPPSLPGDKEGVGSKKLTDQQDDTVEKKSPSSSPPGGDDEPDTTETPPAQPLPTTGTTTVPEEQTPKALVAATLQSASATTHTPAVDPARAAALVQQQRLPLTNLYDPYLVGTDTCLADARQRLQTALAQTRKLQTAFTQRVYQKYRVCLQPPEPLNVTLANIAAAPDTVRQRWQAHTEQVRLEKEVEKKQAAAWQAELKRQSNPQSPAAIADQVEQCLYLSAGLHLVLLPENDAADWTPYTDGRGPVSLDGQRSKSISAAASTAGQVMVDRARKAAALRAERQRSEVRAVLPPQRPKPPPPPITIPTTTATTTTKQPPTKATTGRNRALTSTLTASNLLNLHYSADQLDAMSFLANKATLPTSLANQVRVAASTAALMAKGVGAATPKMMPSTQLRLRHPHPESLGGQRRAGDVPSAFSEEFLKQTLPPLPTVRDRLERPPLDVWETTTVPRAEAAVQKVLKPFENPSFAKQPLGDVTKIRVLHNLWKLGNEEDPVVDDETADEADEPPKGLSCEPDPDSPLDPVVAFLVLHSAGFIGRTQRDKEAGEFASRLPPLDPEQGSEKLERLRQKILQNAKVSFTDTLFSNKRPRAQIDDDDDDDEQPAKRAKTAEPTEINAEPASRPPDANGISVMSIRGGGEAPTESEDSVAKKEQGGTSGTTEESKPSTQAPGRPAAASAGQAMTTESKASQPAAAGLSPSLPTYLNPSDQFHTSASAINSLQLAQQLRQGTFPHATGEAGSLPYLVGPAGLQGASLTALNYARQNQAVAEARAQLYAREQQAAALLRGAGFAQGQPHPAALAALLGNPNHSALMNGGQYSLALTGHVAGMQQPLYQSPTAQPQANAPSNASTESSTVPANKSGNETGTKGGASAQSPSRAKKENTTAAASSQSASSVQSPSRAKKENTTATVPSQSSSVDQASAKKAAPKGDADESNSVGNKAPEDKNEGKAEPSDKKQSNPSKNSVSQGDAAAEDEKKMSGAPSKDPEGNVAGGHGEDPAPRAVDAKPAAVKGDDGMKFIAPPSPPQLSRQDCDGVRDGRFHEVVERHSSDLKISQVALKYLVDCGNAVPIPRSLIFNPLRERLNMPALKSSSAKELPTVPKDIVACTILVWLWSNHEIAFRDAFEKSGRIDVDPDCKWLVHAAIDTAVRELNNDIAQQRSIGKGLFTEPVEPTSGTEKSEAAVRLELYTANVVSKSLMTELRVLQHANLATPNFQDLIEYLDEARMCALRGKTQERALLANLLAKKTNISESFSHAYTSSMIRAGEAFGHETVLEIVQDESVRVSSMLPYDVCADDMGEWEDPCRPESGYDENLTAAELKRQAYARAMIQRSLKKLQDRHHIKGGVLRQGPLSDHATQEGSTGSRTPTSTTGSRGYKRKYSGFSEPPPPPGTGSAPALSWAAYEPRHFSAPLEWDSSTIENTPYGQHDSQERPRSLSLSFSARSVGGKKARRAMSFSAASISKSSLQRSTCEIPWVEVAGIFQKLELPKKSPPKSSSQHDHHASVPVPAGSVIVAPFCRQLEGELQPETDESDTEENLTDEYVIAQHEAVLDVMKKKLSAYMEARQKQSEKKRGRPGRG